MSLRLIESLLPADENVESVTELLAEFNVIKIWEERSAGDTSIVKILAHSKDCENILDTLEKKFLRYKNFRIVLLPVEATIPRAEEEKKEDTAPAAENKNSNSVLKIGRISREELYTDIKEKADINFIYLILVLLSAIVASIGILKDNVAIIIGAMVIAPLLGPNMALALGTTLGDGDLIYKASKANAAGLVAGLVIAIVIGALYPVDPTIHELASRTQVGFGDIVLALASGIAGTLAFTQGLPSALIGVMVAVALLPPTVSVGMLAGSGNLTLAAGALQLLLVNVICVNLSAVSTFFIQGVRPLLWWEAKKAKRATRTAILIWAVLLLLLIITITISKGYITL